LYKIAKCKEFDEGQPSKRKLYLQNFTWVFFVVTMQASICDPQLQEGDEIVYINGRKAEQLSHEQVI
jgi:hypothetical protein